MKRRIFSGLLALVLMLSCLSFAQAASQNATLVDREEYADDYSNRIAHIMTDGEKLYILQKDQLKVYNGTSIEPYASGVITKNLTYEEPNEIEVPLEGGKTEMLSGEELRESGRYADYLFFMDGTLWGLNMMQGRLYPFSVEEGKAVMEEPIQMDWQDMVSTEYDEPVEIQVERFVRQGSRLYLMVYNDQGEGALRALDLKTGKQETLPVENILAIGEYEDGKLILIHNIDYEDIKMGRAEENVYQVMALDTQTMEEEKLFTIRRPAYQISDIRYNPENGFLYYAIGNKVYRAVKGGGEELCAYLPSQVSYAQFMSSSFERIGDTVYALTEAGLVARGTDPANLPASSLTIYGGYENKTHLKAAAELDNIPVTFAERRARFTSAQQLAQAMVSGEDEYDILMVSVGNTWGIDFKRLMEKGYAYPLTASKSLTDSLSQLYPFVQDQISYDGQFYGMPCDGYFEIFGVYLNQFKSLQEEGADIEIPHTFLELCQLITLWNDEYMEEYSDYTLNSEWVGMKYKEALTAMAVEMYSAYMAYTNQPMTLDTPVFREIMTAIENTHTDHLDELDWEEETEKKPLFSMNAMLDSYSLRKDEAWYVEWNPLKLTEETPLCIPVSHLSMMFINPRSKNPEAALKYLEAYDRYVSEIEKVNLRPGMTKAVLTPEKEYQNVISSIEENITRLKKSLEKCEPMEREELEEFLKNETEYLEEYKVTGRYLATEESLAAYHQLAEKGIISGGNFFWGPGSEESGLTSLLQRYQQGQINLDQFIQETENKLHLMQLEEQ